MCCRSGFDASFTQGLIPCATKRLLTVIKGIFNCCHLTRPGSNDMWETVHWFLEDDNVHIWLMLHSNICFVQLSLDKKIRETSDLLTENQKLESRLAGADEDYRRYTIPPLAPLEVPGSYRNAMYIPYPENALLLMFCLETVSVSRVNAWVMSSCLSGLPSKDVLFLYEEHFKAFVVWTHKLVEVTLWSLTLVLELFLGLPS